MKSKNILLAGIAASALAAAAGGAHALSLSGTTVGNTPVAVTNSDGSANNAYRIAKEASVTSLSGSTSIDAHLTTGQISSGQLLVTYTISGATFNSSTFTGTSLQYAGATHTSTTATVSSATSTSVAFIVTIGTGDSISDFILPTNIFMSSIGTVQYEATVSEASNTSLPVDNGSTGFITVISPVQAFSASIGSTSATNATATIASNFKLFENTPCTSPCTNSGASSTTIGSVMATAVTSAFRDLSGSNHVSNTDVTAISVVATGSTLGTTEQLVVGSSRSAAGVTNPSINAIPDNAGSSLPVILDNNAATGTILPNGPYTLTVTDTVNSTNYNQTLVSSETATVVEGAVSYEGVTLNAPWVGDDLTNGILYQIRLGNVSGGNVAQVSVLLKNPVTTGTTGAGGPGGPGQVGTITGVPSNGGVCTVATGIPAQGELIIDSATLVKCFGGFKRSDVVVNVQGAATALSAKMRASTSNPTIVSEVSLGFDPKYQSQ